MSSPPLDDLPWPELGNLSRGATRGNQGQKGVLGPPDREGRCILQLRVQPGVLAVRLNRQASDWYRSLDNEVNRALKLTKTFWRKARRRQDYDPRADQDHMELHEWLQQLKDKTMSHLEVLMQKGDIQGPPYIMTDDLELTFLRKFIERQNAGIPHNPRLRTGPNGEPAFEVHDPSVASASPEPSEQSYIDQIPHHLGPESSEASSSTHLLSISRTSNSGSPSLHTSEALSQEASTSKQSLQMARAALSRAQKETQEAFQKYTACLETERLARSQVAAAEKRRDDIMTALLSMNQGVDQQSRHSSVSLEDHHSAVRYHAEVPQNPSDLKHRVHHKSMEWPDPETQGVFGPDGVAHLEDHTGRGVARKHSRTWESNNQLADFGTDTQYNCEDMMPARKRMHHMIPPGYEVLGNTLMHQNMALQS